MTNTTQAEQKQSLLDTFINDKGEEGRRGFIFPKQQKLKKQLKSLLNYEIAGKLDRFEFGKEKAVELLCEYRSTFDWDEEYSVEAKWELFIYPYTHQYQCETREEALAYLNGEKECEEPDCSELTPDYEMTGDCSSPECYIQVNNLRVKPNKTK